MYETAIPHIRAGTKFMLTVENNDKNTQQSNSSGRKGSISNLILGAPFSVRAKPNILCALILAPL
jgi:hypothetical protein